ncbi:MAG: hypothetical protein V2G48_02545 [bacterium JZ-2024 1]
MRKFLFQWLLLFLLSTIVLILGRKTLEKNPARMIRILFHLPASARVVLTPQVLSISSKQATYHSLMMKDFSLTVSGDLSFLRWNYIPDEKILSGEFSFLFNVNDLKNYVAKRSIWLIRIRECSLNSSLSLAGSWIFLPRSSFQMAGEWKILPRLLMFTTEEKGALPFFLKKFLSVHLDFFSLPWNISIQKKEQELLLSGNLS